MKRLIKLGVGAFVVLLIVAQAVRPDRTNPPSDPAASFEAVAKPPAAMARVIGRACRDCHSNETTWPWYSRVAPVSWLVASDVNEGRSKLNFSRWNIYSPEMTRIKAKQICREAKAGEMPPSYYLPMHPEAKLSPADIEAVCSAAF